MPLDHPAQLHLCHERIEGRKEAGGHSHPARPWCDLAAYAWCYQEGCGRYVCDIHAAARHWGHNLVVEFPDKTARAGSRMFRRPQAREDV